MVYKYLNSQTFHATLRLIERSGSSSSKAFLLDRQCFTDF